MRRSVLHRLVHPALLAALVAGCAGQPAPTGPSASRRPAGIKATEGPLVASSVGPVIATGGGGVIANNGGGILSNNAGNLTGKVKAPAGIIANNGGSLISDGGGGLVSDAGGGVIANNGAGLSGARYALQAVEQAALAGATVRLLDASGTAVVGPDGTPLTAKTDAQGNYAFNATLPTRNLIVEVTLPGEGGAVKAIVPRDGGEKRTVDVDLVSTLTTGYIVSQYVRTQADPLATFDKLPGDVEADTRLKAAKAVDAVGKEPPALKDADVVAAVEDLRRQDATLDAQLETVKKLLVVAGVAELGDGKPALEVALGDIDDMAVTSDGTLYILTGQDRRVWRLRKDGILETAVGDRENPVEGENLDGQLATAATLYWPKHLGVDRQGRLLVTEKRGLFRLEADGTLKALVTGQDWAFSVGAGDEAIAAKVEPRLRTPEEIAEAEENGAPIMDFPGSELITTNQAYGIYRCKPGAAPERLFQIRVDPEDYGEPTNTLTGLAWDGSNRVLVGVNNGVAGKWELHGFDLATKATTVAWSRTGEATIDGTGYALYTDDAGVLKARALFDGDKETTLPPTVPGWLVRHTIAPDGTVYASQFDRAYKLGGPAGPVPIAGTGSGQDAGGSATEFSFRVLSDVAVTPAGLVYAIDTGKGAVYKVDGQQQITKLGDTGRGNVQMLRSDPNGNIWMADGDGTGIGKFDGTGTWTKAVGIAGGLLSDFCVAADGTVYAASWDHHTDRKRRIWKLGAAGNAELFASDVGVTIALDKAGVLHRAGAGTFARWDGAAWQAIKEDPKFDFGLMGVNAQGMAIDAAGRPYLAVPSQGTIFRYDPATGAFKTIAGKGGTHFTGEGSANGIRDPRTPCFDAAGNLYFSDPGNRQVKKISKDEL